MNCTARTPHQLSKLSDRMDIRPAVAADAGFIASLIRRCEFTLVSQPEYAAPFWESMSEAAHSRNLNSSRFFYALAEVDGERVGFIAMRDKSHLFNLFVEPSKHRLGIGRALWQHALNHLRNLATFDHVTVNASLKAVPVYRAFGFKEAGPLVRQHGIEFVPMLYRQASR